MAMLSHTHRSDSRKLQMKLNLIAFAAMAGLLVIAPFAIYPLLVVQILCFALFACAFNLLMGFTGLLSFGHAMFYGWSAYIAGHVSKEYGATPELALLFGMATGAMLGLIVGALAIKRQGIYLAMITLAFAQMMFFLAVQMHAITGGEDGLQGIPRNRLFGLIDIDSTGRVYWFALGVFLLAFLAMWRIKRSPFGENLKAIRENEPRAISLGCNTARYKLAAFVLSAAFSGLAGSLKAISLQLATLTDVGWQISGEVILMTLVGGVGTIFGPVIGAVVVVGLEQMLLGFDDWIPVIYGSVFVLCVLFFRKGILGQIQHVFQKD
ncbi:branched-chain amino acid ABC transporter permease [Pseudooceanicola sp. 216_PA32_1]|uniref:Branched-chain amino acid ABC transporter permease n=2 Tax=Pseudooceanicola pacificus TaxID=2676438 RepID=A0A844W498_9RHOB|nr:branched-chain amino acid ABC transporter permease [Pseudooceanicola pacificus]